MFAKIKNFAYHLLRRSEKYTATDMIYLARGGFWLILGQIVSLLSSFFLALTFANLLPKEIYGTYRFILSIITLFSILSLKDIAVALSRAISRGYEGNVKEVLLVKIKWGSLGSLASILLASYYFFNHNQTLTIAFLITAIFLPFFNAFNIFITYLNSKKLFAETTKYRSFNLITNTIVIIATILITKNVLFILLAFLLSETLTRLIAFLLVTKKIPPNNQAEEGVVSYGKHLSFLDIIKTLAEEADKIILFHYLGAAQLAIYTVASAPIDHLRSFILNIKDLAFPKLSQADPETIKKTLPGKILKASLVTIPIAVVYILLAPWLFSLLFPQYHDSVILSQIIVLCMILTPTTLLSTALSAQKQIYSIYKLRIGGSIGRLIIYFIAIKFYGLLGLAIGRVVVDGYFALLYLYLFKKIK